MRAGKASHVILAEAADRAADLLVVGAHGAGFLAGPFQGSTAENVVRANDIPVLVVKNPPDRPYGTVLLAVDTSAISSSAARTGSALTPGASHIVVHISVVVGEHLLRMRGIDEAELANLRRVSTDQIRPHIEELASSLTVRPARIKIESGHPHDTLPELAGRYGADLVVVGTGTRSKLGYVLLGSVAQHVLRQAPSDVLVCGPPR